jgi:SHS2 domain-containing protein
MSSYEFTEHTADIGIEAGGNSLAEAYAAAAAGMFALMVDPDTVREIEERRICVHADDAEGLLFEWLNDLLYYVDAQSIIFSRFVVNEFSPYSLEADCFGEPFDPARHEMKTAVKSATYHLLEVDPESNRVRVILDV